MLINVPSSVSEVVGEHSVTSRNGTTGNAGDPGIGLRSREILERLPRGGGDRLVGFEPCWGGKSIEKWFNDGAGWVPF
jgi:hypothetical protein